MSIHFIKCGECLGTRLGKHSLPCPKCSGQGGHWEDVSNDIHTWFNLTYAQYLTIPRSVLQSMPLEWQQRFVKCLEELDDTIDWYPKEGRYFCELRKYDEHLVGGGDVIDDGEDLGELEWCRNCYTVLDDPLQDYQRGRRQIPHKKSETDNG